MPLRAPPINYSATRAALAQFIQQATGLEQNSVVMMQPEAPLAKRPETPFCTFQITTVAQQFGQDALLPTDDIGVFRYVGPRLMTVQFQAFGETHEQAYEVAAILQAGLGQEPYLDLLRTAGIVVWSRDAVTDLSQLLSTGFEGRAGFNASFGLHSDMLVNVGSIDLVPVSATIATGERKTTLTFTAGLEG